MPPLIKTVDNGGAIVKNPDGSFTAVSDIDFIGYRLKNLSNPKDDRDAVNKIYVDKKLSLPSLVLLYKLLRDIPKI